MNLEPKAITMNQGALAAIISTQTPKESTRKQTKSNNQSSKRTNSSARANRKWTMKSGRVPKDHKFTHTHAKEDIPQALMAGKTYQGNPKTRGRNRILRKTKLDRLSWWAWISRMTHPFGTPTKSGKIHVIREIPDSTKNLDSGKSDIHRQWTKTWENPGEPKNPGPRSKPGPH